MAGQWRPQQGQRHLLLYEAPCAYLGSASRLFRKRPVLISEAPRAYFGGALNYNNVCADFYSSLRALSGQLMRKTFSVARVMAV